MRLIMSVGCGLLVSACEAELYSNLDQRQANEVVATLVRRGIPADRLAEKSGRLTVMVEKSQFAEAVRVLNENGLPREDFSNLGEVFKKDGLVSSPVQERAQMIFALSQELSRTVSDIDGVLSARVHLVLPENDPLQQRLIPSSASVFIRHNANVAMAGLIPQIKTLVANGIAGLSYDKVSVVLIPVNVPARSEADEPDTSIGYGLWAHRDSAVRETWLLYGLFGTIAGLLGAVGYLLIRGNQRSFTLTKPTPGRMS